MATRDAVLGYGAAGAVFLALWEAAPRLGWMDGRLLPPFSDVVAALGAMAATATFWQQVQLTLLETLTAFAIALPVGALLGVVVQESRFASLIFKPLIFFVFSIPKSIFLPIFILILGIAFWQKVAFGVFSTVFIVMMTTFSAVESVREDQLRVARSLDASTMQKILFVYLPSMTPVLLEAVRVAMIFNFTGILLAEMYASREGIGNAIGVWGLGFQIKELLAMVLFVSVLAISFNEAIRYLEAKCEHWRN
ncbi:ABC transporter permease subunit [Azospirillum sp. TSA2s]|uniref:ABC transporter permease n=1 Tax=Azospirillum sp. TSA2s TaxID=709810 RepID=UPI0010AA80AC|nr:ABC transporter permease subunit [Azospirillum sp. TSA2s]QCG94560.1 ABC transporter permease subunit [Azospirillum sp. TSA2s]